MRRFADTVFSIVAVSVPVVARADADVKSRKVDGAGAVRRQF